MTLTTALGAMLGPFIGCQIRRWLVYPIQEWAIRQPHQERWWMRLLLQGRDDNLRSIGRLPAVGDDRAPHGASTP